MRSASLLPSTPAGLRGSERLTVPLLVGLFGGSVVCLGVCSGAVRCVPLSPFRSGLAGGRGVGPVCSRCLSKLLLNGLLVFLFAVLNTPV